MDRVSASGAIVYSGLIPSLVKPVTLKLLFTAFLLDFEHLRDSVQNKPASLPAVPLGKALRHSSIVKVVDRRPVTLQRVCYSALITSS